MIRNIGITVEASETVAILESANTAGKSTTCRGTICGLLPPQAEGEIVFEGQPLQGTRASQRRARHRLRARRTPASFPT